MPANFFVFSLTNLVFFKDQSAENIVLFPVVIVHDAQPQGFVHRRLGIRELSREFR